MFMKIIFNMDEYLKELDGYLDNIDKPISKDDVFKAWKNGFALGIACYNDSVKSALETAMIENDIRKYDALYDNLISSFNVAMNNITKKYNDYTNIFTK